MSRKRNLNLTSYRASGKSGKGGGKRRARLKGSAPIEGQWQKKVDPFFVLAAEYHKKITQLGQSTSPSDRLESQKLRRAPPPPDLLKEVRRLSRRRGTNSPPSGPVTTLLGLENRAVGSTITLDEFMLRWLAMYKYGTTIEELLRKRDAGDFKAAKRLIQIQFEYEKWAFGKSQPDDLRFKVDRDHFLLMGCGLDLGLAVLSGEELADCFEALCPCGKEHFAENLKKLRARILKTLARLSPVRKEE